MLGTASQVASGTYENGPRGRDRRAPRRDQAIRHQLADENRFPPPVAMDGQGRLRNRREVRAWAQVWRRRDLGLVTGDGSFTSPDKASP
jgi:hypothetical protein